MDVSAPHRAIVPGTEGDVLVELAAVDTPRSGRQVAERIGRSHVAVSRALQQLAVQGIVIARPHPPAILYSLNREHIAAPVVQAMADLRIELLRRLRELFAAWDPAPVHVSLFGSTARRDGDANSDVDLMVIRPDDVDADDPRWEQQLGALSDDVHRWTGNHAQILEFTASELRSMSAVDHPTIANIRADAVLLAGTRLPDRAPRKGTKR